jgi:PAS domain S-box-containing protein
MANLRNTPAQDLAEPERLAQSQRVMLDFAMDRIREAAFLIGEDGRFVYVNGAACRTLGYAREELLKMSVEDTNPGFARAPWKKYLDILEVNGSCTFESHQKTKDGRTFPVEVDATYFEHGGQRYDMAFVRDISERKRAEMERQQAEEQRVMLEFALERVHEAAFVVGGDGRFVYVNGEACRSLGYNREELAGMTVSEVNPDLPPIPWNTYLRAHDHADLRTFEARNKTKDGRVFPVEVTACNFKHGDETYRLALVRDITERRRAEEERRRAEAQRLMLEFALDRVGEAAFVSDIEEGTRFLYVNAQASKSLGYSREELLRLSIPDIDPAYTLERLREEFEGQPGPNVFETWQKTKDGRRFPVEVNSAQFEYEGKQCIVSLVSDITERKRAEEQRAILEFAMDRVHEGAFLTGSEGRFLYVNGEAARSLGYSREELIGMSVRDIDPDVAQMPWEEYLQLPVCGNFSTFEARHKARDGRVFPVEITAGAFTYDGSDYTMSLVRGIAERKRAEEQRAILEFALESVHEGAFLADIENGTRFLYVNAAACRSLGYSREELLGMSIPDIDPDLTLEQLRERFSGQRGPLVFETRHKAKDGRIFPVEIKASYFEYGGKLYGMSIATCIEDRKRVEEERFQADGQRIMLEFALDHVLEGAFLIDTENDARIVYANAEAACSLGYSREELLGLSVAEIDTEYSLERFRAEFRTGRQPMVFESRHRSKDGSVFPVEVTWSYFTFAGRRFGVALARDITERKLAEEEQRRAGERRAILELAMNNVGEAAFLIDREARFVYVNEAACRSLGYDRSELLRMAVPDIEPDFSREVWDRTFRGGVHSRTFETRHKRKDGRVYPAEIKWIRFEHAGSHYGLALASDISERKREEARRAAHLRHFESMDRINRAIQGAADAEQMMERVLDAVLAVFECDRAWIIRPGDRRGVIERTKEEYPGAAALGLEIDLSGPSICRGLEADGPRQYHEAEGRLPYGLDGRLQVKSMMTMPIDPKVDKVWFFGLHQCSAGRIWPAGDEILFKEIGLRVCDALTTLLTHRNLRQEEQKYHEIFDNVSDCLLLSDVTSGGLVLSGINPSAERRMGVSKAEAVGKLFAEGVSPEIAGHCLPLLSQCLESGGALTAEGDLPSGRSLHTAVLPVHNASGAIYRLIVINRDITERKAYEKHLHLLMREIDHRAKNLLSVVQAVVRLTAGQGKPELFERRLNERIAALASSHDLLVKNEWRGVDMRALAAAQSAHFKDLLGKRIVLAGPDLLLKPAASQALGMALHELMTNAGKYGALSCAQGCVGVEWDLASGEAGERLYKIRWSERGGPPPVEPGRFGFGHRVMVQMAEYALDGQVSLRFPSTGLVWELTAPVASVLEAIP